MRSLVSRAPTRIDFGGGWTDVPPYCDEQGGHVCNLAIGCYATVRVRRSSNGSSTPSPTSVPAIPHIGAARAPASMTSGQAVDGALAEAALRRAGLDGVTLELRSEYPVGAGLGGSSAAGVAMTGAIAAWRGEPLDRSLVAERSRQVEVEDLGIAGGRQDHYAAAYGGALGLTFGSGVTDVQRIGISAETRHALERRCIVGYTGQSRISGDTITAVLDAYRARDPRVVHALARMHALALEMTAALDRGAVDDLGELVGEHWEHQRSLHTAITTPIIDEILLRARMTGALGGKALGASGGGCVLVIASEETADRVRQEVSALASLIPVAVDEGGLTWMAEE